MEPLLYYTSSHENISSSICFQNVTEPETEKEKQLIGFIERNGQQGRDVECKSKESHKF